MKNVLITGVSGYIGSKIAKELDRKSGVSITGIDIKPPSTKIHNLNFIKQDVRQPLTDIIKKNRIDSVIHTAYVLPPDHNQALMEDINISGTMNVLKSSIESSVKQILYTSSTTAYGFHPDNDLPLTENSPLRGNDDFTYSKNKKEIEKIIAQFIKENEKICVTVLRPCFVVGPGFDNPLSRHLRKKIVPVSNNTSPMQFVHENDLLRVMILCLEKKVEGFFNVTGEGTVTFKEMIKLLKNYPVTIPEFILKPFNYFAWNLRLKFLTEFPNPALNLMKYKWIASSEKLKAETGFKFEHDSLSAFQDFANSVLS